MVISQIFHIAVKRKNLLSQREERRFKIPSLYLLILQEKDKSLLVRKRSFSSPLLFKERQEWLPTF
jgi:hypothetical protein